MAISLAEFVTKHKITMSLVKATIPTPKPYQSNEAILWNRQAHHYHYTLIAGNNRITSRYCTGEGWTTDPTILHVLDSLLTDISGVEEYPSFPEYSKEFFDATSSKQYQKAVFNGCKAEQDLLKEFLSVSAYDEFVHNVESEL